MLKSLSQSIKTKWKRALSGLLAVVTVAGIAGATGWNSGSQPLTVYSTESGKTQITAIPASDGAAPIPFALLEDSGGERVKVGLAVDGGGNVTGWEGGKIEKTGWADKKDIFINLPDVLPGIAYNRDGGRQFSSRLSRYEYVVPGSYALAEQLALLQREAMTDGDTLVVCQSGQTVSVSCTSTRWMARSIRSMRTGRSMIPRMIPWPRSAMSCLASLTGLTVSFPTPP